MNPDINLPLIMLAALIAGMSPGPATLAIAGTSMLSGRKQGLALASGITTGSLMWSISAALGLGALMLTNAWMLETMRYVGACYLLYLAYRAARSAFRRDLALAEDISVASYRTTFGKGLALHLTNPKAILFFGSLFSIGVPANSSPGDLAMVILAVGIQSALMFHFYAVLFSSKPMASAYAKARRWFEGMFAIAFGFAGFKILTTRFG